MQTYQDPDDIMYNADDSWPDIQYLTACLSSAIHHYMILHLQFKS